MVYSVAKLMNETRRLAASYYQTTLQTLPVTNELARHDAVTLLALNSPAKVSMGVDAVKEGRHYQIKGRVVLPEQSSQPRIGQLNFQGEWDQVLLVIYNADYQPREILMADRDSIQTAINTTKSEKRKARGALSVAKFRNIASTVWNWEHDATATTETETVSAPTT